jgi:hypothetical protein
MLVPAFFWRRIAETFSAQMMMKGSGIRCWASRIAETFSAPTRRVAACDPDRKDERQHPDPWPTC